MPAASVNKIRDKSPTRIGDLNSSLMGTLRPPARRGYHAAPCFSFAGPSRWPSSAPNWYRPRMALLGDEIALPRGAAPFLVAVLALAAAPARAQTLVLHDGDPPRLLGEVTTVLEDATGQLDASRALAPE